MKFHHIGIFVKDLQFGESEISKFVDIVSISDEVIDEDMGVRIIFVKDHSNIIYELVAPFGSNSPVNRVLSSGKDYLNHIAYLTNSFDKEVSRIRMEGMVPLGPAKKAKAFHDSRVIFFLTPLGFIIELIDKSADEK